MALYKRGSVWWMRLTFKGHQVRKSTETSEKKLAERIYRKVLGQVAEGKWFERLPGDDKTVCEMLERYLREHSARNKAPLTYRRDKSLADHLIKAFGDRIITEVSPKLIVEYKIKRREAEAAAATINLELALLRHAFTLAFKEWEWVKENPVGRVSKEKVSNQIERWLTLEEEKDLMEASPLWLQQKSSTFNGLR